jgi:hypothetical protein
VESPEQQLATDLRAWIGSPALREAVEAALMRRRWQRRWRHFQSDGDSSTVLARSMRATRLGIALVPAVDASLVDSLAAELATRVRELAAETKQQQEQQQTM